MGGLLHAQTNFAVTNVGFQYYINGTNNTGTGQGMAGFNPPPTNNSPPLTLHAGATYTFSINVQNIHPVGIVSTAPGNTATRYSNATPQSIFSGTITLVIPATNFPSTLYYECTAHFFYGVITVLPPLATPPPPNTIISLVLTPTTVTMTSSGTNTTYSLVPEFNSNLVTGSWQSVPSFTNTFTNGTNFTTFNRLDDLCGSNVFLRISQRP